jgi:hypothetical protein
MDRNEARSDVGYYHYTKSTHIPQVTFMSVYCHDFEIPLYLIIVQQDTIGLTELAGEHTFPEMCGVDQAGFDE